MPLSAHQSIRLVAKSHFRNGGANLPVCRGARQAPPTISEMTFGNHSRSQLINGGARGDASPVTPLVHSSVKPTLVVSAKSEVTAVLIKIGEYATASLHDLNPSWCRPITLAAVYCVNDLHRQSLGPLILPRGNEQMLTPHCFLN